MSESQASTAAAADAAVGPTSDPAGHDGSPRLAVAWMVLSVEAMLVLLILLPVIASFTKFGFYDEGAWMRLDALFASGRTPTVDLGYSYGMLPLMLSRAWFALLGPSPAAYIAFVAVCHIVSAWGLAVILQSLGLTWKRLAMACAMMLHTLFAANFSLMHPLEMTLIVLALSRLARGGYASALSLATAAAFTKPSMGYVLGFLLLLLAGRKWLKGRQTQSIRVSTLVMAPALTAAVLFVASVVFVGWTPAWRNILPLTGGRSYELMNFGILRAGMEFWWRPLGDVRQTVEYYLLTPAAFWIAATLTLWGFALPAVWRLLRGVDRPTDALLATIAALHAAFVGVFYAWHGSWAYYAYLPVLGVLVVVWRGHGRKWLATGLALLALLASAQRFGMARDAWRYWERSPRTAGLWTYREFADEFEQVRQVVSEAGGDSEAFYLVNGGLSLWWPEIRTPECWFVSPGIPTPFEMAQVTSQVEQAGVVVLCKEYDPRQEAWNWPEFAGLRSQFTTVLWDGPRFRVLTRPLAR